MDIFGENTFPKRETSSLSLRRKAFGLSRKDRSNRKSCTVVVERRTRGAGQEEEAICYRARGEIPDDVQRRREPKDFR